MDKVGKALTSVMDKNWERNEWAGYLQPLAYHLNPPIEDLLHPMVVKWVYYSLHDVLLEKIVGNIQHELKEMLRK